MMPISSSFDWLQELLLFVYPRKPRGITLSLKSEFRVTEYNTWVSEDVICFNYHSKPATANPALFLYFKIGTED